MTFDYPARAQRLKEVMDQRGVDVALISAAPVSPDQSRRLLVRSRHGVSIAVWEEGDGPPMVLVHGSLGDHTAWAVSVAELRKDFTTFAVDWRE